MKVQYIFNNTGELTDREQSLWTTVATEDFVDQRRS